jgi:hypothetical protein
MQVMAARIVLAGARLAVDKHKAAPRETFLLWIGPGLVPLSLLGRLSSFATATTTAMVVLLIADYFYALLTKPEASDSDQAYQLFCITALAALAVTMKLSAVVFAGPAVLVATAVVMKRRVSPSFKRRALLFSLGAALVIGGPWMVRGVILTGYPLFPSTIAAFPVDWRVPEEHAAAEYALAAHSAKASTKLAEVIAGRDRWGWLPNWFRISLRDPFDFLVPLIVAALATIGCFARARAPDREYSRSTLLFLLPIAIGIVAWFLLAPEGRYVIGFFWSLAAFAVAEWWRRTSTPSTMPVPPRLFVRGASFAAIATLPLVPLPHVSHEHPTAIAKTLIKATVRAWDSRGWYAPVEAPRLRTFRTYSGLDLHVPTHNCAKAPIPCTPNPAATLALRDPSDISRGFRVCGPWTMEDWPFKSRPDFLRHWRESRPQGSAPIALPIPKRDDHPPHICNP